MILGLVFALIIGAPQQDSGSTESQATMKQQAHDEYERHKQSAIRINELARRIHSEADASAVVSEIAGLFAKELPPAWASGSIRQRVANAEYESVRNPVTLIPEQRIVDVWNQYVKEIGAPDGSDCLSRRNPQHARWVVYICPVDVGTGKPNNLDDAKRVRARA